MTDHSANPFETPRPRGVPALQGTLRVIVSCYCFGVAAARFHQGEIDPAASLFLATNPNDQAALATASNLIAYFMVFTGVMTLLRPVHLLSLLVMIHAASAACADAFDSATPAQAWEPILNATRWMAPFALLLLDLWPPRVKASLVMCVASVALLRLAAVATFVVQGFICLQQCHAGGDWADLVQQAARHGFHREINDSTAQFVLGVIGATLIAFAATIYSSRKVSDLFLVAFGAFIWTLVPLFALGRAGYDETLLRCSEWGAPLVVALFQLLAIRRRPVEYVPERSGTRSH